MPRILGVDIPNGKRTVISLRYIYGIGPFMSDQLCERAGVDPDKRARDLTEDELAKLAALLDNEYVVEGQLRRQVQQAIGRLREIGCYRGLRHRKGLPVRGQRTRTNARTRKGPRKTVAGKKGDHPWAVHTFGSVVYAADRDEMIVPIFDDHLVPGRFTDVFKELWPKVKR